MLVIDRHLDVYLVKIGHDYHIVRYDERANLVHAVYSGDRIQGHYMQCDGFTPSAVKIITKGRKKTTAAAYFGHWRRMQKLDPNCSGQFSSIK